MVVLFGEFLSTHKEIHSFTHGIYDGMTEWKGLSDETKENPDVIGEEHYAKGGYVIGTLIRVAIILLIGRAIPI